MKHEAQTARSPVGEPLDAASLDLLRAALREAGPLRLSTRLGVSANALTRAASGLRVLRGTRELILRGLAPAGAPGSAAGGAR